MMLRTRRRNGARSSCWGRTVARGRRLWTRNVFEMVLKRVYGRIGRRNRSGRCLWKRVSERKRRIVRKVARTGEGKNSGDGIHTCIVPAGAKLELGPKNEYKWLTFLPSSVNAPLKSNLERICSARTILLIEGLGTVVITRSGRLTERLGTLSYHLVVKIIEKMSDRILV